MERFSSAIQHVTQVGRADWMAPQSRDPPNQPLWLELGNDFDLRMIVFDVATVIVITASVVHAVNTQHKPLNIKAFETFRFYYTIFK